MTVLILFALCIEAPGKHEKVEPFTLPGMPAKHCINDIAGTCPVQQKYVHQASSKLCFAANLYAREIKRENFEERIGQVVYDDLPIIFESFRDFYKDSFACFSGIKLRISESHRIVCNTFFDRQSCFVSTGIQRS